MVKIIYVIEYGGGLGLSTHTDPFRAGVELGELRQTGVEDLQVWTVTVPVGTTDEEIARIVKERRANHG